VTADDRARRFTRDYLGLAGAEGLAKLTGFAAFALLARALEPRAYGVLELAVSLAMVGLLVIDFGLGPIASRWITQDPDRADAMSGTVPAIRAALAALVLAAAAALGPLLAPTRDGQTLVLLFATALLFAPWILDWLFQGLDRMAWVAPAQLLRMSVFLGGVALFVDRPAHLLRVGGIEIAALASLAAYYVLAARGMGQRPALRPDTRSARELLREATPVGVGQWLWVFNQYLPIFALAWWFSPSDLGYFAAAHRVVFGLGSFVFLYFFALYPTLVVVTGERPAALRPLMDASIRATAWLGGLAGLLGTVLAAPFCTLAYGAEFAPAAPLLALLAWVLPIHLVSGHARFALIAAGHPLSHLWAQAAGVVVGLAGCALLVPAYGSTGAALAALLAAAAVWGWAHVALGRRVAAGSLPGLEALWRPAAATLVSLLAARWLAPAQPLLQAALATTSLCALAALSDGPALRSLRASFDPGPERGA